MTVGTKRAELSTDDKLLIRLRSDGGNDYKILHVKKKAMRRSGNEICQISCDPETILKANDFLNSNLV